MYIFFDVLATPNSAIFGLFQSFYIFFRVDGRSQVFSRPYNARVSGEHGRSPACEAEGAEGTGVTFAVRPTSSTHPSKRHDGHAQSVQLACYAARTLFQGSEVPPISQAVHVLRRAPLKDPSSSHFTQSNNA
jgi:hypothetical protein